MLEIQCIISINFPYFAWQPLKTPPLPTQIKNKGRGCFFLLCLAHAGLYPNPEVAILTFS